MDIRMYTCGFGDCFRVKNNGRSLFVDFGVGYLPSALCGCNKTTLYEEVIKDIDSSSDFLLTHYHADHYSGAVYFGNHSKKKFNNVYIPDVWTDGKESERVVTLFLLKDLMSKRYIKNDLSLISFLKSICKIYGRVYFVKKGSHIQDDYIALWPVGSEIKERTDYFMNHFDSEYITQDLTSIARRLVNVMVELNKDYSEAIKDRCMSEINSIGYEFVELYNSFPEQLRYSSKTIRYLRDYGNEISIVFQNLRDKTDKNILFTGDVRGVNAWREISSEMYDEYDVIKIPHHGTRGYYQELNSKIYLVPNKYEPSCKSNLRIDNRYLCDSNRNSREIYYSENNNYIIKCSDCGKNHTLLGVNPYFSDF